MRIKCLSMLILIFLLATFFLFIPTINADPSVIVYSYELSPAVFMPGDNGVLTLTIKNVEATSTLAHTATSGTTTTVTTDTIGATINDISISPAYGGDKQVKAKTHYADVCYLAPSNSIVIEMELLVDENITEGLYFPKVNIDIEESAFEDAVYPIKVRVSNSTVDLIGADVPSKISMSGSTDITLTAINNREASVDAVTIAPAEIDGIDFVQDSIFVGELDAYSSEDLSFSIIPKETGMKTLNFEISYLNGENLHTNNLEIPIEIIETLDVAPVLYSIPSTIGKGSTSKVRLEVYNAKTESISGVIVTPVTDVILSPSQYFIGSMDADDVFSASFNIHTENLEIGSEQTINFKVLFKQGDNYYETPMVSSSFKVVQPTENNSGGSLSQTALIIFIIIIIVIFLFYRWKKRRIPK